MIATILCFIFLGWSWMYETLFCGIYTNTQLMWLYGGLITVLFNILIIQGIILPFCFLMLRMLAQGSYRNSKYFL
jgi:hypothetical protein